MPDGKTKYTHTTRNGDWVKRETRTSSGTARLFKPKAQRARKTRLRKEKNMSISNFFFTILMLFIIIVLFS
jgi:hypothetical protein